ncbi:MAG: DinB family protein [Euzebyales bacterium]|nr:DinB family protein [Euzebyales bacterium]
MTRAYVESGTGMHVDDATVAWTFDLERWGECGLGSDEATALAALGDPDAQVAERIHGDEQAFVRDRQPASDAELDATMAILAKTRAATLALLAGLPDAVLDWDDPDRILPSWARWRTLRQLAWHVADTESRYYLTGLGEAPLPRGDDLLAELERSAAHVATTLLRLPRDRVVERGGEVWTTTKLLRRLAWHERGELAVMRGLAVRAQSTMRC